MMARQAAGAMAKLEPAAPRLPPSTREGAPSFHLGKKQIFIPSHVITFLRKEHLPPNEACFRVPLTFTKFDLRDYLWNLYNVEVTKVRSHVRQMPLVQRVGRPNSWYRPQAQKIMIVELAKPFQWPDVPENLEPWHKELWDKREKMMDENQQRNLEMQRGEIPLEANSKESKERTELRKRAQQLLKGEIKWDNELELDPKWEGLVGEQKAKVVQPYSSSELPSMVDVKSKSKREKKQSEEQLASIKEESETEKKD